LDLVNVYPVPTNGLVSVEFTSDKIGTAVANIHDVTGKEVASFKIEMLKGMNAINIDMTEYPAGTYMLSINNADTVINTKLIKD